jgi:hypothetical protein
MVGSSENGGFKSGWNKSIVASSKRHPGISLKGLGETTKNVSKDSLCHG